MSEQPSSLSGSAYLRLFGLGAVIGIPAAFIAALFLAVVHDVERWLWDSLPSAVGHSARIALAELAHVAEEGLPVADPG